jgi:hypothetical protein
MQQHKYHKFFLPILFKLYQERNNEDFVDITECLSGTTDQKVTVVRNLFESDFALIQDDSKVDLIDSRFNTIEFSGKILPLGIDYVETFIEDFQNANKKNSPVGFKTSH